VPVLLFLWVGALLLLLLLLLLVVVVLLMLMLVGANRVVVVVVVVDAPSAGEGCAGVGGTATPSPAFSFAAGNAITAPTHSLASVIPFALWIPATVAPYFAAISLSVSPHSTTCHNGANSGEGW
jgi:hypothetical protein